MYYTVVLYTLESYELMTVPNTNDGIVSRIKFGSHWLRVREREKKEKKANVICFGGGGLMLPPRSG